MNRRLFPQYPDLALDEYFAHYEAAQHDEDAHHIEQRNEGVQYPASQQHEGADYLAFDDEHNLAAHVFDDAYADEGDEVLASLSHVLTSILLDETDDQNSEGVNVVEFVDASDNIGNFDNADADNEDDDMANAAAKVLLPRFWPSNPSVWFLQVEAVLVTHNIIDDTQRYHLIVAAFDSATADEFADIIGNPPATDKYTTLKGAVISRTTDSTEKQILNVLTELHLGDKKPSALWREMKNLAGNTITDARSRSNGLTCSRPMLPCFFASSTKKTLPN